MATTSKKSNDATAKRKLRELFAKPNMTSLLWNHAVGEQVNIVIAAIAGATFGKSVMHKLARFVQPNGSKNLPGHLSQTRRFATLYTKAEVMALARRKDSKDRALGWQRMARLLSEPDAKKRAALLEQCLANAWTVRWLQQVIQQRRGGKRTWGGRRPTVPKSVPVLLRQITQLCEQWEHWAEAMGLGDKDMEPVNAAKKVAKRISKHVVSTLVQIQLLKEAIEGQAEQGGRK